MITKRIKSLNIILFMCIAAVFAASFPALAQSPNSGMQMVKAKEHYASAQYDNVIKMLTDLVTESDLSKDEQKEIFLLLGRSYLAKGQSTEAKWAITNLLELEPPLIEPDPDTECPPLMKIYYDVRKSMSGTNAVGRPDPGIQTIAVLDFKNRSVTDKDKFDPMEKGFSELLINQLDGSIALKLIERERISWILDEIGLENDPELFDVNSAVRVGKQLGVHSILLGSFIIVNDQIKLLARLVKVETSEILATEDAMGDIDDFFSVCDELGTRVAKKINVNLESAQTRSGTETRSLDAMLAYSEGLALVEKGSYEQAFEKFRTALEYDPGYQKAKERADSLKPLIG
jgi:TolB-like protein